MISWRGRLFQYSFTLRLASISPFVVPFPSLCSQQMLFPSLISNARNLWVASPVILKGALVAFCCQPRRFECIQFVFCGMVGTKGVGLPTILHLAVRNWLWICISGDSRYSWPWSPLVVTDDHQGEEMRVPARRFNIYRFETRGGVIVKCIGIPPAEFLVIGDFWTYVKLMLSSK